MRRLLITAAAALALLLTGCATTIRSDVTTFHEWPANIQDKTYVVEAPPVQDNTPELRHYQNLVRSELARLGFREAGAAAPALRVGMRFMTTDVPVRVLEAVDPFMYSGARYGFGRPFGPHFGRPYWGGRRYWGGGFYSPFYDPFWRGMPMYEESIRHVYQREMQLTITSATDGKRLFDVTVRNSSSEHSTPLMMPALVHSAFAGFPGVSGVARRVELKRER